MGLIPEKKEYKNFTYDNYLLYTEKIEDKLGYQQIIHTPYNAKNHFDRFGYLDKGKKVVVVYDVKAKIMSVTAHDSSMKALEQIVKDYTGSNTEKKNNKTSENKQNTAPKNKNDQKQAQKSNDKKQVESKKVEEKEHKKSKKGKKSLSQDLKNQNTENSLNNNKKKERDRQAKEQKAKIGNPTVNVSQACLINQYYPLSFNNAMQNLRNIDGVVINTLKTLSRASDNETVRYLISKNGMSGEIEFMPKKGTLTIDSTIANEIKGVFLTLGGQEMQTNSQPKQKSINYETVIASRLSSALKMLSANQKNDLGASVYEIEKQQNRNDYYQFVVALFKVLENFILDLLKSENVQIKAISQAYDKDKKGSYQLKECYKKRCKIVYNEVLSALYYEFCSLNLQNGQKRKNVSKQLAEDVVKNLMNVIEYNCKKLEEINYTVKR